MITQVKETNHSFGRVIQSLEGHRDSVYAVNVFPDRTTMASGSADTSIRIWYCKNGRNYTTKNTYGSVLISPFGAALAPFFARLLCTQPLTSPMDATLVSSGTPGLSMQWLLSRRHILLPHRTTGLSESGTSSMVIVSGHVWVINRRSHASRHSLVRATSTPRLCNHIQ